MLLKLLNGIDRRRFSPTVISLTSVGVIGHRLEAIAVPVYALNLRKIDFVLGIFRLVRLIRSLKPDLVHTWMYHADLIGGLAAKFAGVKKIVWGIRHSNLKLKYNKLLTLAVVKGCAVFSYWLPLRILTCSKLAHQTHVSFGYCGKKFSYIPNGFDISGFKPDLDSRLAIRSEFSISHDVPVVGLIGRRDVQKNHIGFVKAASIIQRAIPGVEFVLVGENIDSTFKSLVTAISSAGLIEHFHLLGRREDVAKILTAFDVLVSSSVGEGFPNVLGEAMACGVPCVVTDVGDSADIVGESGRVVCSGDMQSLAVNVVDLLLKPELRLSLGNIARRRVKSNFDIVQVVLQYQDLYTDVFEGKK